MDRINGDYTVNIRDNQFIEIRRTFADHSYEVYRLEALPGTAETVASLEEIQKFLTQQDNAGLVNELLSGKTDIAQFDFNDKHQIAEVKLGTLNTTGKESLAKMHGSAQKVANTFQDWHKHVTWSETKWPAPTSSRQSHSHSVPTSTTLMKVTAQPSTATAPTAAATAYSATKHLLVREDSMPRLLEPSQPPSPRGGLDPLATFAVVRVATPPSSPTHGSQAQVEPLVGDGDRDRVVSAIQRPRRSSTAALSEKPSSLVSSRLASRVTKEFKPKKVSVLEHVSEPSSRLLVDIPPEALGATRASLPVIEEDNAVASSAASALASSVTAAPVLESVAAVDAVAEKTLASKPRPRLDQLEIDAKVDDMYTILDKLNLDPAIVTPIIGEYKRQLNDPDSTVYDAKSFLTLLKTLQAIAINRGDGSDSAQKITMAIHYLTQNDCCDEIDRLFFKRFTGAAKVVYVHGDVVYMTHKQADKENELKEEYAMTVTIRVKSMQSKIKESIKSDSTLNNKGKTTALRQAENLCKKYEEALNNSEKTGVFNASSFLEWLERENGDFPGIDRLQLGSPGYATVAQAVDDSLKYIDAERVQLNIDGTMFYTSPKGEGDLKNFFSSGEAANLNPEQFHELVESMDKMTQTMESVGLLHGDIKPDNILIYKTTQQDAEGNNSVHYHMKIADFGKSAFDGLTPKIHSGNTRFNAGNLDTLENQRESMFYIKMMLLTSTYKWDRAAQQRKENVLQLTPTVASATQPPPVTQEPQASAHLQDQTRRVSLAARTGQATPIPPPKSPKGSKKTKEAEKTQEVKKKKNPLAKLSDLLATPLGAYLYDQGQGKESNYFTQAEKRGKSFMTIGIGTKRNTQSQMKTFLMNHYEENYMFGGSKVAADDLDKGAAQRDLETLVTFRDFYKTKDKALLKAIAHLEQAVHPQIE